MKVAVLLFDISLRKFAKIQRSSFCKLKLFLVFLSRFARVLETVAGYMPRFPRHWCRFGGVGDSEEITAFNGKNLGRCWYLWRLEGHWRRSVQGSAPEPTWLELDQIVQQLARAQTSTKLVGWS
jgi:hypothetical protein